MKRRPARIEYRYDAAHPIYVELAREAETRGVSLQQHIHDLLAGRYLARQADGLPSLYELLWLPATPLAATELPASSPASGAHQLADEWM